jgi:predicted AlkP superfamily pyrophosphatase or phosphodiesterase
MSLKLLITLGSMLLSGATWAEAPKPKLVIAIAVDQFSANLFDEYRPTFTGGLQRLASGVSYANGFQSHSATETCPGHSTILTGDRPTRTGIVANTWLDLDTQREDKSIYCVEDEHVAESNSKAYTVSPMHLRVPTLGERLKQVFPTSRTVAVAGKDRAAVMMAGHAPDQIWWWTNKSYQFESYAGRTAPAIVSDVNARMLAMVKSGYDYPALPAACRKRIAPITYGDHTVGVERAHMAAGDGTGLYSHPALDQATLDIAIGLVKDMKLGQGTAPDVLAMSLSVTDPVGHMYGTEGPEQCGQIYALDAALGHFLDQIDATGVPYTVVLTADHGGLDIPERTGAPQGALRVDSSIRPLQLDINVGIELKLTKRVIFGEGSEPGGNLYIAHDLSPKLRSRVAVAARKHLIASPFVEAVFMRAEILAAAKPTAKPSEWSLIQRVAASYDPVRSGDLYVVLKKLVMPISDPGAGSIATHGSAWNYDRRVPILFYSKGMAADARSDETETVNIMPTLAALTGLKLEPNAVDGKCLSSVTSCDR